ncbi:ADP-dependent glucokinase-like [Saccoglossus kowalevskii]|uniref:ADP-dependent glucokinase-like n=1 Tax=Saccoglossus kowalevskii TaxID=10224 RepID=A0ABM0GQA8_SACKO|nr:PREDICTED: ADP-dependent glucokinase-like [Saccoglossus kowalevskii]
MAYVNSFTFGITVLLVAYFYSRHAPGNWHGVRSVEEATLQGWESRISLPSKRASKVAVGVNGNTDLIVSGTALLKALNATASQGEDHNILNSIHHLQETFSHFFEKGAAAERYFANGEVYKEVIKVADTLPSKQYYVGGNAALAGQKISSIIPDSQVLFVGPVGPKLKKLFHKGITVLESSITPQDEVHLIMEFPRDELWAGRATPIASRFITSNDQANGRMDKLEIFAESIKEFGADMVVLSGLHLLPGQSESFWMQRLDDIVKEISKIPHHIPVHLELASLADTLFMQEVIKKIFPIVNSLGLNEQELSFVSLAGNGPHQQVIESEEGFPEIGIVGDIMHWILQSYGKGNKFGKPSKLTRVHFHSLSFHILVTIKDLWSNSPSSVAMGTRTASQQACGETADLHAENYDMKIPDAFALSVNYAPLRKQIVIYDPMNPVVLWHRENLEFYFSPVLVCRIPRITVGLGDSISAMGLYYSEFKHS